MSGKGFFFTLDMLFAVIVALGIISGILYFSQKNQQNQNANLYMEKVANDILVVLGKNQTLETLNSTTINNSLSTFVPQSFAVRLNVTVYQCADGQCSDFSRVPSKDINLVYPFGASEKDFISARRAFLTFENKRIKYFSLAELRLWSS